MSKEEITVHDVDIALTRKLGAIKDEGKHHIYFYLQHEGSEYTVGKLSHSWSGSLNDTQVKMCADMLCIKKRDFESFVSCTKSRDDIVKLWQGGRSAHWS